MDNKITMYLCDDNEIFISKIKAEIYRFLDKNQNYEIIEFNNSKDLIKQWEIKPADAVFLDIDMPKMNGFDTAALLQKSKPNTFIIFVTSHEDQVYNSWVFQPFWFVRKSHMDDLEIVIPRLLSKIVAEREKESLHFQLSIENCTTDIDINALTYIESMRHDIIIHYKDKNTVQLRCKISDAEKQLRHLYIIRIQSGIIVNCRFIAKITSRSVILTSGEKLHLNRNLIEDVKSEFQKFIRSKKL